MLLRRHSLLGQQKGEGHLAARDEQAIGSVAERGPRAQLTGNGVLRPGSQRGLVLVGSGTPVIGEASKLASAISKALIRRKAARAQRRPERTQGKRSAGWFRLLSEELALSTERTT